MTAAVLSPEDTELCNELEAALAAGKIAERQRVFAADILTKTRRYGHRDGWAKWMGILLGRTKIAQSTRVVGDFSGVYDLFQKAAKHLKYPKVVLNLPEGMPIRLYVAGERSRLPGVVNVVDARPQPEELERTWYGRVTKDGKWDVNRSLQVIAKDRLQSIANLLKRLAKNPAEVAAEYGRLTGNCCFCMHALDDARSIAVGYGPVCAERYGLPWGKGVVKTRLRGKEPAAPAAPVPHRVRIRRPA